MMRLPERAPECPECAQGKCVNCTLQVPSATTDKMLSCRCRENDHRREDR